MKTDTGSSRMTAGKKLASLLALAALCGCCSCRNPFFPPTGTPGMVKPLRSTPEGVITQLVNAYELKDIDLYEDLFPTSRTFQFFVTPLFARTSYPKRTYGNPPEQRDTLLRYIGNEPYYYYWSQETELQIHRNMFSMALSIQFTTKPEITPGKIRYLTKATGDTVNVEMETTNGEVSIIASFNGTTDELKIAVERQVYFLERDAENLWVIRKWYDFSSRE